MQKRKVTVQIEVEAGQNMKKINIQVDQRKQLTSIVIQIVLHGRKSE